MNSEISRVFIVLSYVVSPVFHVRAPPSGVAPYVSLESALSRYGWTPEGVHSTECLPRGLADTPYLERCQSAAIRCPTFAANLSEAALLSAEKMVWN